jgi:hypothetical protein
MKKTLYVVLSAAVFLMVTVPHAQAAVISSQEDSSGTPSHYWHSDGSTGAFLVLDPNGGPGYSIGDIATTTTNVVGIHIKVQFNTDGAFNTLPRIPILYDESGTNPYACAQLGYSGYAYGSASDALALTNPLQYNDYNGKMVDMYFQCDPTPGHVQVYPNTSYRLYFYPISTADVSDIYVAMNAAGTAPFYEISDDGTYPPPAPPISISVPQQGTTYFSTDTIIPQATVLNLPSYSSVTYLLNGIAVDPTLPLPIATLPNGTSTLVIAAINSAGNTIYATSTFMVVNNQPPVVAITTPLNGYSYLQNATVLVSATASSSNAIATTTYALNGVPVNPNAQLPLMSQPLGTANLVVSATDIYGNTGYATSTFTILPPDVTPPTVTIINPTNTTYTNTATVILTANIADASGIIATSSTFTDSLGKTTAVALGQPLPLLGAALGPANVSVAATDAYGNVTVSTVNFTIKSPDVTPPTIIITNPIAGKTYAATSSVLVAATVTDASGVATTSYTLNGIAIDPTQPLPFAQVGAGPATLVVTATDTFGNAGSSSVSFIIAPPAAIQPSSQVPVVVITSPVAGQLYLRNSTVFATASITDKLPIANVHYFFNGQLIDPTKPLPLTNAPLGTATVSVIAKDSVGNVGSSTVTFRIVPGDTTCVADITEAFDHKWIPNKQGFTLAFNDCQEITAREGDRNNYYNDDHNRHKDPNSDNNYLQCNADINNEFIDINKNINN